VKTRDCPNLSVQRHDRVPQPRTEMVGDRGEPDLGAAGIEGRKNVK
jgi:hypothetical protein